MGALMNPPVSMLTTEIADLTGKAHFNVMRDAKKVIKELHGEGGIFKFEDTYTNPQNGQPYSCLRLPKRETMVLVTGYSIPLRAAVIDRLEEPGGKNQRAPPVGRSPCSLRSPRSLQR